MIKKFLQKAAAFVLCTVCFLAFAPDAAAAQLQGLPGQELWQPYLEKAPQSAESFVKDPLKSLLALLPGSPAEMIRQMAHCYADVLLFLLLLIVLSFLVGGAADSALLELAAAVGCGTLLWGDLISLAQLEKLPSGFSSGVQRCARCRWRGECQHSGKRSAADRAVLSGTGYGACGQSAAAELPCGKHGVLHQHPAGAFGNVPCHGRVAAQGACLGWADFCSAVRAAKSGKRVWFYFNKSGP